ncbi:MAG TPA: methyl-accepting chemotaxis protein [Thermoanaerobaculia bacterium]
MSSSRRYSLFVLAPPLIVALPLALLFLFHVTTMPEGMRTRTSVIALLAYAAGALTVALVLERLHGRVVTEVTAKRDPGRSMSELLSATTLWTAGLWIGGGLLLALAGWSLTAPSFLTLQYFVEAALIVAAPAMAWSYWAGKARILRSVEDAPRIAYQGRVWPVRAKIAIVFVGFFFTAVGALVLVISSRVARELGEEAAWSVAGFGLAMAVAASVVFAIATWFLGRDITGPMTELVNLADEMAQGRFTAEPRIFSDDEIGVLGRSFGTTRQNLRMLIARVGERGETITGGVRSMTAGTDSLVGNAHEQSGMAVQSATALQSVRSEAQSVLEQVDRVAASTYDAAQRSTELRASFGEVARRMDELFQSVEKISSAATEIDASARETAGQTSRLESIGTDVLAFVAEMEATVEQITRTADSTTELSKLVRDNALDGRAAVEATVEGIRTAQDSTRRTAGAFDSLQKSLGQIDQILLFIDEVTNRTNLLSLNAGIIAAQAGANDFGFSVIADEIRQLADRTRTATKEIAGIIKAVQPVARQALGAIDEGVQSVDRTVGLAQDAATALDTILGSADRSLEMTESISRAIAEQSKASRHLHSVTAGMSDNLSQMRRAAEGQADATRMLASESERVSGIALQVKRATDEQTASTNGIASAMEHVATDTATIRDRLERQLRQAEQIATASQLTLAIAERNNAIAEQFRDSLNALVRSGNEFQTEVARFRA